VIECGRVGFDGRLELEPFSHAHDRHAVITKRAGQEHLVAGPDPIGTDIDTIWDHADSRRVDVYAVAVAAIDHLRVAGHDLDAGPLRGICHGDRDRIQLVERETLLDDERRREEQRRGS
jgi:hypothetical protein